MQGVEKFELNKFAQSFSFLFYPQFITEQCKSCHSKLPSQIQCYANLYVYLVTSFLTKFMFLFGSKFFGLYLIGKFFGLYLIGKFFYNFIYKDSPLKTIQNCYNVHLKIPKHTSNIFFLSISLSLSLFPFRSSFLFPMFIPLSFSSSSSSLLLSCPLYSFPFEYY